MSSQNDARNHFDAEIKKLLENVAEDEGLSDYKIEKICTSMKGDGYMGAITTIRITGSDASNKAKVLDLVVKSASKSDALRSEAPVVNVYERESYMYNVVIPAFQKFETEKGLSPFSSSAKCYKTLLMDKSEALILENLVESGYSVWNRKVPMENDHAELVMTEYGRFHALSFALRDQSSEYFEKLCEPIDEIFDRFQEVNPHFGLLFEDRCVKAGGLLDPVKDKEALAIFKVFTDEELLPFFSNLRGLIDEYSVILHGDCWTNNMMFKYENKNNPTKPTKMCLIDLQIARIGPPVLDLSYYFYTCCSNQVISNYEHYLDVYYNSLADYLRKLGSNPDEVFPYSVFRQQWKDAAKFGLICAMLLIHIMLSEQNEVTDLADAAESKTTVVDAFDYDLSNAEAYKSRVRHIILHFVNNQFI